MPSRADDSFLLPASVGEAMISLVCQCPLGLMTHFYVRTCSSIFMMNMACQCPLGLMTHFYKYVDRPEFSYIEPVSMPSRADDSFLHQRLVSPPYQKGSVSMPSRADDSFLQYPFKNLGFMRFPEPIFAGICQNILTSPLFRACLQFGHI